MVLLGRPPDGEISNKNLVLSTLDERVGSSCDVEYLWVEGSYNVKGSCMCVLRANVFGHAAIAYRHPESNEKVVMNIVGKTPGTQLVNFLPQKEYLFGVKDFGGAALQGGIYNRNVYGLRISNVAQQDLLAMHYQYVAMLHEAKAGRASFNIVGSQGPMKTVQKLLPILNQGVRLGNCAKWTSFGLVRAGLLPRVSLFPKQMLVRMMIHLSSRHERGLSPVKCCLVKYARIDAPVECHRTYPSRPCPGLLTPIHFYHNVVFWNLDRYCTFTVRVKNSETRAANVEPNSQVAPIPTDLVTRHVHYATMVMLTIMVGCAYSGAAAAVFALTVSSIW